MVTDNKDGFLVDVDYLKSTLRQAVKELVANQARSSLAKTVQPYTETQLRQFEPQIRYNEEKAEAERRIQANPVGKINSDWCPVSPGPRGWL